MNAVSTEAGAINTLHGGACNHGGPYFDETGRFLHPCQHPDCCAGGCFGFGVFLTRYFRDQKLHASGCEGWLGRWYCADHVEQHRHDAPSPSKPLTTPPPSPSIRGAFQETLL